MDMSEKTVSEKITYLKGLAEGMALEDTKEGKLIKVIMDILDDMAEELYDVEDAVDELSEQIDAVDEDLSYVEDEIYGDEDGHGCECGCDCDCDCDCDCGCGDDCCCGDDECYEVECPNCHDVLYLDDAMIDEGKMECPNCGATLEFDFDDCCDCEDGCDCEKE